MIPGSACGLAGLHQVPLSGLHQVLLLGLLDSDARVADRRGQPTRAISV